MKEIRGINHVGIRVRRLEQARQFYQQLGFEYVAGPMGPEPVAIMKHPCGLVINFILNADHAATGNVLMDIPQRYPGYTHIALDVSELDSIEKRLHALGIDITEGPLTLPDGGRMLFIRDQDSNVIEFHQNP